MKSLTLVYTTSREKPQFNWFLDSLDRQLNDDERPAIIIVNSYHSIDRFPYAGGYAGKVINTLPKPTIWQGEHKITRDEWWAKSNALNTGICLCKTEWIAFVDDRSVLAPTWLDSVKRAMEGEYAVCGSYEKYANLQVVGGEAKGGELLGEDTRRPGCYDFDSWYGGSGALPLEWCLAVNGYSEEMCDSLGSEDSQFGTTLLNSGYPVRYDSEMRIIEDRTPGQIDGALKRADKNSHLGQRAKSWDIVRCFRDKTSSQNSFDIRNLRDRVLSGEPFPPPSASHLDWYDGTEIKDFE